MTTLAIDPHGDDLALFAAFTVQRLRPHVVVCFDSYLQPTRGAQGCDWETRRQETRMAMAHLLTYPWAESVNFLGLRDDRPVDPPYLRGALWQFVHQYDHIIYPAYEEGGHEQHNAVALACREIFNGGEKHTQYLTYTRGGGKSRGWGMGRSVSEVPPQSADEIQRKLRALACYRSQMQPDPRIGCAEWFYANDFREYIL